MMSRTALLGMFAFAVAGLTGCTTPAHMIRHDQNSVVVAVPDNTNTWPYYHQDAAKEEAARYVSNPMLVSSSRVKVGEQTTNTQDMTRRELGGQNDKPKFGEVTTSSNTTTVSDKYEHHLVFQSGSAFRVSPSGSSGTSSVGAGLREGIPGIGKPAGGVSLGGDAGPPPIPGSIPTGPATSLPTTPLPIPGR
jgi:hypothetical protein